jgi:hypothetical protein
MPGLDAWMPGLVGFWTTLERTADWSIPDLVAEARRTPLGGLADGPDNDQPAEGRRDLARQSAREGESFSATVARLVGQGARAERGAKRLRYVASGDGPVDLGRAAERYLNELVEGEGIGVRRR